MKIKKIDIREIEGFLLGNAEDSEAGTGVTAVIAPEGAVAGVDVRGGGPATRETDLLRSENTVEKIHAVVLSGGSAFGLEAASGVMRVLAEKKIGFRIDEDIYVPIVPGASLYDLPVGRSDVFPDVEMGKQAAQNAFSDEFQTGNHGAGTGTTVGKYRGYERAMKTGLGTFACGDEFIQVGAIAAVNAVGDIYNGAGNIIAGLRTTDGSAIKGTIRVLKGLVHDESSPDLDLSDIKTIAASEVFRNSSSDSAAGSKGDNASGVRSDEQSSDEKDDIVKAMMKSYELENTSKAAEEPADIPETVIASPDTASTAEPVAQDITTESQAVIPDVAAEPAPAADPAPEDLYLSMDQISPEPVTAEAPAPAEPEPEPAKPVFTSVPETEAKSPAESTVSHAAAETSAVQADPDDEFVLTEEDKADMGYDIPFNTTISVVITNAVLTKSQANKLAQILHDAYARAIKPVHSTLDGDTVFVMSTCRQKVNFDAFAALATDVLQYAIIDGAASAQGAYGLPAARDMIRK